MQKLTIVFVYGKDETRKLKYRVTDDTPISLMLEKLLNFQFIVDCADPKTFLLTHKGAELTDTSKTFADCGIADGDELYIMPTVFEIVPPLPNADEPLKLPKPQNKTDHKPQGNYRQNRRDNDKTQSGDSRQQQKRQSDGTGSNQRRKPSRDEALRTSKSGAQQPKSNSPRNFSPKSSPVQEITSVDKKAGQTDGPVPFKPHTRTYHRSHTRRVTEENKQ